LSIIVFKNSILQYKYIISIKILKKELITEKIQKIVRIGHNISMLHCKWRSTRLNQIYNLCGYKFNTWSVTSCSK